MCILRVVAKRKRKTLSDFLCQTRFPYCDEHDRDAVIERGLDKGKPYRYAGFQTWVSRGKFDDLPGQVAAAIRFLRRHRDELKKLRNDFEIRDITLDFGYNVRVGHNNVAVQWDLLPPALVSIAGELGIGIEMTLYRVPIRRKKVASRRGTESPRGRGGGR